MRPPDLSEFHELTETEELRRVIRDLQVRLRRSEAKTADLIAAVYRGARDATVILGKPQPVRRPPRDRRTKQAEVGVLHLSDWHVGKETASFNTQVAGARIRQLGQKVAKLADIERADHPVNEIHVLLGGDMVENVGIFAGQPFEVDSGLFTQMFAAVGIGTDLLRSLLAVFPSVHVWEEPGNHGRLGRKGDHPAEDNADLLVYRLIRERLGTQKGLTWHETQGWHSIVEIGNYRLLLIHGDEIKSFGGNVPAFGITRKVNSWATGVVAPFTDAMLGHFHQSMVLPIAHGRGRIFVDPSIESDSVYATEFMASSGTPGQRLNFVDPERGRVTTERIIWLDAV